MLAFLRPYAPPSSASSQVSPPGYGNPPSISPGGGNLHVAPEHVPRRNKHLSMAEHLDPGRDAVEASGPFFNNAPSGPSGLRGRGHGRGHSRGQGQRSPSPSGHERGTVAEGDDPVSLRALSEVEANSLVQLFHARLNPLVAVLDPQLHTMGYLRRTSSVLFASVLASASRFFRHDVHAALLSHARTLLDRALQAGSTDIGVIQSLMIQTYWKDPEDTSGWMKVGIAIRLGYSLFWHIPRTDPLPDDERAARELLNAERTWFCLFSFDRGQSYIHGLPYLIRLNHHGDPEQWARAHAYLGRSVDMHIAASIQLCKLKDEWGALCERAPEPALLEVALETLTLQAENLIAKWFTKDAPPPGFDQDIEGVVHWSILDFVLVMQRYRYEMGRERERDPVRLDQCLCVVGRIVREIEALAANGLLIVMQDSASCMTSSLIVFVRNNYRDASRAQRSFMLTSLHRIFLAHTALLLEEDSKTAPGYVVRFIRRVLGALSVESRGASPSAAAPGGIVPASSGSAYATGLGPGGPDGNDGRDGRDSMDGRDGRGDGGPGQGAGHSAGNGTGAGAMAGTTPGVFEFFHELGLEEFLHVPEFVAQNEADDGRYWANMLLSEVIPQQVGA